MEVFLRCYFEHFNSLPRNTLHDRRKRKSVVDYISTLIEGCSQVELDVDESAKEAIRTIIKYHYEHKLENGQVCKMGKYHNILYVGVKLCYDWQVKDAILVGTLLEEIYYCEKTFERIFIGAIFGNKAPHYIAGWKSDFDSEEENIRAVVYFLDKANYARLELAFGVDNNLYRFIDLPIESCGKAAPLKICVQLGLPDKLLTFLRFGSKVYIENEDTTIFEHLFNRLLEFNHVYPYNLVSCLQILLRAVPRIKIDKPKDLSDADYKILCDKMFDRYSVLIEDGLVPPNRCGITPPELKHLCRCVVRQSLWENYELPDGIRTLQVPGVIWRYLDLLED